MDTPAPTSTRRSGKEIRTPAVPTPVPAASADGTHDLKAPEYYLNRELTWLNFNFRVLQEAADPRTPLLERVKFLSIVSSNLDEFFMKRIGGLKQQMGAGVLERTPDGRTARQQVEESLALVRKLEARKRDVFVEVYRTLRRHDIRLAAFDDIAPEAREGLRAHFLENIYPLLTPQATDPAHPFPFISNLSLNLLVALRHTDGAVAPLARVKVPIGADTPRFLTVGTGNTFVPIETVIAGNLDILFPGMEVESVAYFRVTRNANTETSEEHADDLLAMIESELRERQFAPVVRLEVSRGMDAHQRGRLTAELGLDEAADVFEVDGLLGLRDLLELYRIEAPELRDAPHHPVDHPLLATAKSVFHATREARFLLLHHPYQAFSTSVERLLQEAARDPKVRAIKMTLYRTSSQTKVIDHLAMAARNGKQVAVVVELKARFDEAANLRWASRLEEAGIHVTYGVVGLKTHCKLILVVRQDYDGIRTYAHVGTGNYNAVTARSYSDIGLLTSDERIGREVVELFNYLTTGFKPKRDYAKLLPAPKMLKPALLQKIQREADLHTPDSPGLIRIKTNALEDIEVTRALYRAGMKGVQVELIVRDTCRLRPGIPGLSDNVRVISIVGRFLEHARLFHFRNGGAEEWFLGSADCMRRNLESRVETMVTVEDPALREELRYFFDRQWEDRRSAWDMCGDGSYVQRRPTKRAHTSSQTTMMGWAGKRLREAMRLRKRKPSGPGRAP